MNPARSLVQAPSTAQPVSTTLSPPRQSRSSYRYIPIPSSDTPLVYLPPRPLPLQASSNASTSSVTRLASPSRSRSPSPAAVNHTYPAPPRGTSAQPTHLGLAQPCPEWSELHSCARPWAPVALWVATSLGFLLAVGFWRTELFQALDDFSHWLQDQGYTGYAVLFLLIFITTFPPFPLYSTLIGLSGYCYGAVPGAILSYAASLVGALVVFTLSRAYLRAYIGSLFSRAPALRRVVRAIERRPNLLFLIRLAPYPYNVLNVLLAGAPTLSLRTYALCTALSLFKLIVHTTVGASVRSFAAPAPAEAEPSDLWTRAWTGAGIALCIGLFVYLACVARRAVDEELADECGAEEEGVRFSDEMSERMDTAGNGVLGAATDHVVSKV